MDINQAIANVRDAGLKAEAIVISLYAETMEGRVRKAQATGARVRALNAEIEDLETEVSKRRLEMAQAMEV